MDSGAKKIAVSQNAKIGPKLKVFLVEDDKFFLNMYAAKFTVAGHEVTVAQSGSEALAKIKDGYQPEIMVCDLIMPGMSGIELLEIIQKGKLLPKTTIIALTNENTSATVSKVMSLGVKSFIVKATKTPSEVVEEVLGALN